ncbi:MAG TPA: hypothetical protein VIS48_00815 [Candidatus Kryptonia bacterium]
MKKYCMLLCSLLFVACTTTGPSSNLSIQSGTYTGTFSIMNYVGTDSPSTQQSQTTFTFSDTGWYTCGGGLVPTGGGKYNVTGDSLYLQDMVAHLAIFDWTLILNGSFHGKVDGNKLTLTQDDKAYHRYRNIVITRQ